MSCKTTCSDKMIVLQDGKGKTKMCFDNPNQREVQKILVDNCVIKSGKRCDYLLIDHNNIEHFIELKGKEVKHACMQLLDTIQKISQDHKAMKHSFVVSTACPLTTTEIQNYKIQFKKKYNCTLQIKNNLCSHRIE